jgi:outer membrane lipopolysaccharide assembly protein LptE/RlpB
MRKNKFLIFYLSLLLILNSCGFQLRKPLNWTINLMPSLVSPLMGYQNLFHKQLSFADIKENKDGHAELIIEIIQ